MDKQARVVRGMFCFAALGIAVAGCGGGGASNKPPTAQSAFGEGDEDTLIAGTIFASDPEGKVVSYVIVSQTSNGTLSIDASTGDYIYFPNADFNGEDSATIVASDGRKRSLPATLSLRVRPVNDEPSLAIAGVAYNSAETLETILATGATDVDGDPLVLSAVVNDLSVAEVAADSETRTLRLTPLRRGETSVAVTVSDGVLAITESFQFIVTDVAKQREWKLDSPWTKAVSITNTSNMAVAFDWTHAGNLVLRNVDEMLSSAQAIAGSYGSMPGYIRLWRFITDNVYWWPPVTPDAWIHDPLVLINSLGFGYCDDVATVLAMLGRAAGHDTRVQELDGHVVPEIYASGRWKVLDPSLAVFYKDSTGNIVGVEELAADPSLITSPHDPVLAGIATTAYSEWAASIYAASDNHRVVTELRESPAKLEGEFILPAGARITYPGKWADAPSGINGKDVPAYAQLRLDLPVGFSGRVALPFVLWATEGEGQIEADGVIYPVGSVELTERRRLWYGVPASVFVTATGPVSLVYLLNPLRYGMVLHTRLELRSIDAWALEIALEDLEIRNYLPLESLDVLRNL